MHPASFRNTLRRAADWHGHWRALTSQPRLDVVFVGPVADEAERRHRFADPDLKLQHVSGPRVVVQGVHGQSRLFNLTLAELQTRAGRAMGRERVVEAIQWAQQQGARVVLLAAGARELFALDGAALKARFPELVLTHGENGRAWLLSQDAEQLLVRTFGRHAAWRPRVLVLAPYEPLAHAVARQLQAAGHEVLGWGPDARRLAAWSRETGMPSRPGLASFGAVDVVVSASSDPAAQLDFQQLQALRRRRRRLVVLDAGQPATLTSAMLDRAQGTLWRLDAAQGAAGAKRLGGDVAEALALFHAIYRLRSTGALRRDWFQVGSLQQLLVGEALRELGVQTAAPSSFGIPQREGSLQLTGAIDPLLPAPAEPVRPPCAETMPAPLMA